MRQGLIDDCLLVLRRVTELRIVSGGCTDCALGILNGLELVGWIYGGGGVVINELQELWR